MDLNKHLDFFNPVDVKAAIHVVGIGAMGSRIVELLVRLGQSEIHVWDFDKVEAKNVTNQIYLHNQVGLDKQDALEDLMKQINPDIKIIKHGKWTRQVLSGYVFLCVDSIELRHTIATKHANNKAVLAMFDTRMRLTDAQSYAAKWSDDKQRDAFIASMDFTDDEAVEATPVSACGTTLSVAPTVVSTASFTVSNFINLIRTDKVKSMIFTDAFEHTVVTF